MKRFLAVLILWAIGVSYAFAQSPMVTKPFGVTGYNASSTIAATNTFQSVFTASTQTTGRTDCIIQNNGAASMYVYFGPIADATTPNSLTLAAGAIFKCGNNGVINKDQISITGTIGQNFFAIQE